MRTLLIIPLLLLLSLISFPGWSADFDKGVTAFENGDFVTALKEWTPPAEQGNAEASYRLGFMYQWEMQDYKTAVKWYTLAAEQGDARAQFALGFMYKNGEGILQDYKTAVKWYTLAAEQGDARA